jgi:2'-5' RNA ligase
MHLTLRFIGNVHEEMISAVKDALHAVHASAFSLQTTSLNIFGRSLPAHPVGRTGTITFTA